MTNDDQWYPVTELCRQVMATLPELARTCTLEIRRDLHDYADVPFDEHLEAVTDQQRRRLEALAERRLLGEPDLEQATALARRRARQGIGVVVLIGAYHVGDRELWRALCRNPAAAAPMLPDVASLLLESLHGISTALASAHGDVTREMQDHRITLSQRLVELLASGSLDGEAARVADALGFDPEGEFLALSWRRPGRQAVLPTPVQRELDRHPGVLVHSYHAGDVLLLAQNTSTTDLTDLATSWLTGGRVGIGLVRRALAGAALSIADARMALTATTNESWVASFIDVWHDACLLSQAERIFPLITGVVDTAHAHPHLAEAVTTFARVNMSIAKTAKAMHLHANTVTYRLDRWAHLTGWDPRSFEGLARSVVACQLSVRENPR